MLLYDTLDKIAELVIPEGIHPVLHVNSRESWVKTVADLIERKKVDPSYYNIKLMCKSWETLLYKTYSALN